MKKITIIDVAKHAGVSVSTVSRVINEHANVDPTLREKVEQTIEYLNYIPNTNARNIRKSKVDTIGVVLPSVTIPVFAEILEGILLTASNRGYKVNLFSSMGNEEQDIECLKQFAASSCTGLIYSPVSLKSSEYINKLLEQDLSVVVANRRDVVKNVPHVYSDSVMGGYTATKYLLQGGHKRIAFFAGFWVKPAERVDKMMMLLDEERGGAYSTIDRLKGYMKALEEYDIDFDENLLMITGYSYMSGYEKMKEFLGTLTDFDGVICGNDFVASGVLQALQEQNIDVPNKVSVVGYDDGITAQIARPMLTSVKQFSNKIGQHAVEVLIDMMNGNQWEDKKIDTVLTIRNSTAVKK